MINRKELVRIVERIDDAVEAIALSLNSPEVEAYEDLETALDHLASAVAIAENALRFHDTRPDDEIDFQENYHTAFWPDEED